MLYLYCSSTVSVENADLATSYLEGKEGEYAGCSFQAFRDAVKRVRDCNCFTVDAEERKDVKEVVQETAEEVKGNGLFKYKLIGILALLFRTRTSKVKVF